MPKKTAKNEQENGGVFVEKTSVSLSVELYEKSKPIWDKKLNSPSRRFNSFSAYVAHLIREDQSGGAVRSELTDKLLDMTLREVLDKRRKE